VSTTDYVINISLLGLVLLQIRGRRLDAITLLAPLGIVGWAAGEYLRGVPTAGNDLVLLIAAVGVGLTFGVACGMTTHIFRRTDGRVIARAGWIAASLWITGVGARLTFEIVVTHGGGPAIARFSQAHAITSAQAWTTALILMALTDVVGRTGVLLVRSRVFAASTRLR
jgi:hypothetical protein